MNVTGAIGLFGLGRALGNGVDAALIIAPSLGHESVITTELLALTERAGRLFASIAREHRERVSHQLQIDKIQLDAASHSAWLGLLVYGAPMVFNCWTVASNGDRYPAVTKLAGEFKSVWIDAYPDVCLSAVTWLHGVVESAALAKDAAAEGVPWLGHEPDPEIVRVGKWRVEPGEVTYDGKVLLGLQRRHRRVLTDLVRANGRTVTLTTLRLCIGEDATDKDNAIRSYISVIRRAIRSIVQPDVDPIEDMDGRGYRLTIL